MSQQTHGRRMKIGFSPAIHGVAESSQMPRFRDLQAQAQMAEQIGLDSLWVTDHVMWPFPNQEERGCWEAFTFLSALAAVTSRIQLGPLVACASFRNPTLLAKMADSLDEISNGRFILGLGAGWSELEYRAFGYPFDHLASRFEEALQIIVPLLREGQVDFAGNYYQAREAVLRPRGPSRRPTHLDWRQQATPAGTDGALRRRLEPRLAASRRPDCGGISPAAGSLPESGTRPGHH